MFAFSKVSKELTSLRVFLKTEPFTSLFTVKGTGADERAGLQREGTSSISLVFNMESCQVVVEENKTNTSQRVLVSLLFGS